MRGTSTCINCGKPVNKPKGFENWNHGGESFICQQPQGGEVTGYSIPLRRRENMEFKVGDRVTWAGYRWYGEGTVVQPNYLEEGQVAVRFDRFDRYEDQDGELPDHHTPYAKDLTLVSRGQEIVDRLLSDFAEDPAVSYYQFPGDIEVRQISAHLMSFPSQIMQYASRSGRVDGNCKSEDVADKIRDFEKIIDFAKWEIERLEGEAPSQP